MAMPSIARWLKNEIEMELLALHSVELAIITGSKAVSGDRPTKLNAAPVRPSNVKIQSADTHTQLHCIGLWQVAMSTTRAFLSPFPSNPLPPALAPKSYIHF